MSDNAEDQKTKKYKEYYQKNKEKIKLRYQNNKILLKEKNRIYYQNLTEEEKLRRKLYGKEYSAKHKEKLKEYYKKYNSIYGKTNKEDIRLRKKEYRKINKEKIQKKRKIYQANSDKFKKRIKNWSKNHWIKNKTRIYSRRTMNWHLQFINICKRRNRVKYNNTVLDFDADYLLELFNKQNRLCAYFNVPLKIVNTKKHPLKPSLDRIDNSKGYTKDNIVLCCLMANMGRNSCSYEEWMKCLSGFEIKSKPSDCLEKDAELIDCDYII